MKKTAAALWLGAIVFPAVSSAGAPAPPAAAMPPACDGQIVIVYHEKIKQGGSLQGLMDAAKAQEDYWRKQGVSANRIVVARIVNYDKKTKTQSFAADEVYSYHFNPPPREQSPQAPSNSKPDYIDKYRANASILDRKTLCMPKL